MAIRVERKACDVHEFKHIIDLSSARVLSAKFPALGRIVPQGGHRVFRNKCIVFVLFM